MVRNAHPSGKNEHENTAPFIPVKSCTADWVVARREKIVWDGRPAVGWMAQGVFSGMMKETQPLLYVIGGPNGALGILR